MGRLEQCVSRLDCAWFETRLYPYGSIPVKGIQYGMKYGMKGMIGLQ